MYLLFLFDETLFKAKKHKEKAAAYAALKQGLIIILFFLVTASVVVGVHVTSAQTIIVPNDYPTIQTAVDAANSGDTVRVAAGRYYGRIVVDKSVAIIGESAESTFIYCTQETYDPYINLGNRLTYPLTMS